MNNTEKPQRKLRRMMIMFTGIITHLGKLIERNNNKYKFNAPKSFCSRITKGTSVAVNGACLTILKKPTSDSFSIEIMPETAKKTTFINLKVASLVNLELPLTLKSFISGHLIQGHVDGTGVITSIKPEGNNRIFQFKVNKNLSRYMIEKGSVTVNGISLTIIKAGKDFFTIGIIPFTWENTMLQYSKVGDLVNIEVDVIAKYVEKFVSLRKE